MKLGNYTVANEEKLNRAIFGSMSSEGKLVGGVGEEAADEVKLAAYDKLGGLIKAGKYKVKTGSFWDFEAKKPRKEPKVLLVLKDLEGNTVEIPEGEAIPVEVQAAEKIADNKEKNSGEGFTVGGAGAKPPRKSSSKKKKTIEDEE